MTLLVVVDVGVARDEARQQVVVPQVPRDELERGEAEGRLDQQVVDGHELDLGARVPGVGRQPCVGLHERLVEDHLERVAQLLA